MADIDPASLALLAAGAATLLALGLVVLVSAVRRRAYARRWTVPDDVVIDLTFVEDAIRHDRTRAAAISRERQRRRHQSV